MPRGYRVTLGGDNILNAGDVISGGWTRFTTDEVLGGGDWIFTGTDSGTTYTNVEEPGTYYLGTDGNVYFVPAYGAVDTLDSASVIDAPPYDANNVVEGTAGDDLIDSGYVDTDGDFVDSGEGVGPGGLDDRVEAGAGDDTVYSGQGADTVYGEAGSDELHGEAGDDVLLGDGQPGGGPEALNWNAQGGDGTNLAGGFTQVTGEMEVSVGFANTGNNNPLYRVETTDTLYTDTGEPFNDQSSLYLFGNGDGDTSRATISFAAGDGSDMQDAVGNVMFRINDVDWANGNHRDILTITAYDADGNEVPVTITVTPTGSGQDSVSGNTVTAGNSGQNPDDAAGSVLIEIAGPVSEIVIDYGNGLNGTQAVWISDVHFETLPQPGGDDSLYGGAGDDSLVGDVGNDLLQGDEGADTLLGGAGDDTLRVAQGDLAQGGAGDDLFVLTDLGEAGTDGITISGGEGGESLGDRLDLGGVADRTTLNLTTDTPGELAGTIELTDGTLVTFDNIEQIICFTPGTRIRTAQGERRVEELTPGDLILTRDNGPQPLRWIGRRTVAATGAFAPIRIDPVLLAGADAPLIVSPQHRLLWSGGRAQLLFGQSEVLVAAKHLLPHAAVHCDEGGTVTYLHLMFDRHEIVTANGALTESLFPGDTALEALDPQGRDELFALFPELRSHAGGFESTARCCLRAHEAQALIA